MGRIIAFSFIVFGSVMGMLCFIYGFRKIIDGETTFQGIKLLKSMNDFKGSLHDFSGTEIFSIGVLLFLVTALFSYLVFL
jgi:hypothetical protein